MGGERAVKTLMIILALVISGGGFALAGEPMERFSITSTDDGYVRTDSATGATSKCTETEGQLVCRLAVDDRQAYEADIAALAAKVDSLDKRISELEAQKPAKSPNATPPNDEAEFQTSLTRMEQFFRRFMGIVKEFQAFGSDNVPSPDRT
jgi:multidrug resistance efflux pump